MNSIDETQRKWARGSTPGRPPMGSDDTGDMLILNGIKYRRHPAHRWVRASGYHVEGGDARDALDEVVRLRDALAEANEYAARYDAVMETMSIDFEDMFPDWTASSPTEEETPDE